MTIELHTWNTPNGRKISVALEEMGLAMETEVEPDQEETASAGNETGDV